MDKPDAVAMENVLEYISIDALNKGKRYFFVPDYQRGYRWTRTDVEALLDDIFEFRTLPVWDIDKKSAYCLQPIVVKKMNEDAIASQGLDTSHPWFEVIDGQQRLTTIYLVSLYLNQEVLGRNLHTVLPEIHYQTRTASGDFLKNISSNGALRDGAKHNIDFFHMWTAHVTIQEWFKGRSEGEEREILGDFSTAFLFRTKVIWYEINELDVIEVFSRLNMYKIRLTNAELVKALFLNRKNFEDKANPGDVERIGLRQLEISQEWDRIESRLHEKRFWSFLVDPKEVSFETRIDLVLNLVSDRHDDGDSLASFHYFRGLLEEPSAIDDVWAMIKNAFQTLEGWYEDKTIYHRIGFLVYKGDKLADLYQHYAGKDKKPMTRSGFIAFLDGLIKNYLSGIDLDEVGYEHGKAFYILLLHNVLTMDRDNDDFVRFPFERFKDIQGWDVEHIHATADGVPLDLPGFKSWLDETIPYVKMLSDSSELVQEMENLLERPKVADSEKKSIYDRAWVLFSGQGIENDDIGNLVLLDYKTNRSYGAAVFPKKRGDIVRRIKGYEVIGSDGAANNFVPICTRNAFLKFYREDAQDVLFWGTKDRDAYLDDMKRVLSPYLDSKNKGARK